MGNKSKSELFEKISDDYYLVLLNWAYKKTGNRTDGEDLAHEVLAQVFRSAQKEQNIGKLDNFVWKIAHFVWCNYLRKNVALRACISYDGFDNLDHGFLSEEDYAKKFAEADENSEQIKKMRLKISNLNYLKREIMIMYYIDELPIQSISKKLSITEANVKWHLHNTRNKLKKEISEMSDTNFVYRPGKLHMAVSGNSGPAPDTLKINENLVRQNICLACYKEAKTTDELADMLGIAKAYIEYDLKWLVERQFMQCKSGRYSTMFSIKGYDFHTKTFILFLENKSVFSDVIVDRLISEQDNIKAIGFGGSEQPIEKLMWFLVYRFTEYALNKVVWNENRYPLPERPIMPDGGQYFPLGFAPATPEKRYDFSDVPNWDEKYERIGSWDCNGSMTDASDNYTLRWYGLYTAGDHTIEQLFRKHSSKNHNTRQVFFKTFERDFDISRLNAEEKEILGEMINNRWISKNDDKIIPNFSVFTKAQAQSLTSIFEEMYNDLKSVIYGIFAKIEKLCRADLPKHLESYLNYHIYMTFYDALKTTTGFAYYDGKIYDPKDEIECGLLTFHAIKNTDE